MTKAAVLGDQLADVEGVLDGRGADESEHRHQLLAHERMAREVRGVRGSGASRTLASEAVWKPAMDARLAHDCPSARISTLPSGANASWARRFTSSSDQEAGAHALEFRKGLVPNGVVDNAGLLGRADHRRVEGLRDEHVDDRHGHVSAAVDVHRRVAWPDAHAGLARLVCGGHRLGAAGRPDEINAVVVEQVLRDVKRRVGDHLEGVGRESRALAGLLEDRDGPLGATAARADGRKTIALRVFAATIA